MRYSLPVFPDMLRVVEVDTDKTIVFSRDSVSELISVRPLSDEVVIQYRYDDDHDKVQALFVDNNPSSIEYNNLTRTIRYSVTLFDTLYLIYFKPATYLLPGNEHFEACVTSDTKLYEGTIYELQYGDLLDSQEMEERVEATHLIVKYNAIKSGSTSTLLLSTYNKVLTTLPTDVVIHILEIFMRHLDQMPRLVLQLQKYFHKAKKLLTQPAM